MITAVDSSVIFDVLADDPRFRRASASALHVAASEGRLVACDVVWAEVASHFGTFEALERTMGTFRVELDPVQAIVAFDAGQAWRLYRSRGGSRVRVLPDFLVGAHALHRADRLLARGAGFQRTYFADLVVVEPGELAT